jgi:YidC/Oxa1 family membrane protein insertase
MPEPAVQTDPTKDEVILEDGDLRAVFTAVGGRLKRAYVKLHMHGEDVNQLVPIPPAPEDPFAPALTDTDVIYPLGLRFSNPAIEDGLDRVRFSVLEKTDTSVLFAVTLPGVATVRKKFSLAEAPYVINVEVDYENLREELAVVGRDEKPAYILNWGPNVDSGDLRKGVRQAVIWRVDGKNDWVKTAKLANKDGSLFTKTIRGPEWIGVKSAYFMVALRPEDNSQMGWVSGRPDRFRFGTAVPRFEIAQGATQTNGWRLYVGPSDRPTLAQAWDTLPTAIRFFESVDFMDKFSKILLAMLNWFYSRVPSYGLAIIFLTVVVRSAMFPLTIKQMRSMKKMQLLAPEMEELKKKYGEDQQEYNKKMWELYRQRGVNPLGGCLPMLLQFPIFIALYRMLWSAFELKGAPFILIKFGDYAWIRDLSEADRLLHMPWMVNVPFVGPYLEYLNILPLLGAAAMVLSTKLTPTSGPVQNPQQKMMMTFMPVFFGVVCYRFASGLNLYILTSTVLGIVQSKLVRPGKVELGEKKPLHKKKQHFYTAAQARKRRLAHSGSGSGGKKRSKKEHKSTQRRH